MDCGQSPAAKLSRHVGGAMLPVSRIPISSASDDSNNPARSGPLPNCAFHAHTGIAPPSPVKRGPAHPTRIRRSHLPLRKASYGDYPTPLSSTIGRTAQSFHPCDET